MSKKKKQKKAPYKVTKRGTIILFPEMLSEEKFQEMKALFDSIPCKYDFVLQRDNVVHLNSSYIGLCQWCHELIYTKDVCPVCGKLVDMS